MEPLPQINTSKRFPAVLRTPRDNEVDAPIKVKKAEDANTVQPLELARLLAILGIDPGSAVAKVLTSDQKLSQEVARSFKWNPANQRLRVKIGSTLPGRLALRLLEFKEFGPTSTLIDRLQPGAKNGPLIALLRAGPSAYAGHIRSTVVRSFKSEAKWLLRYDYLEHLGTLLFFCDEDNLREKVASEDALQADVASELVLHPVCQLCELKQKYLIEDLLAKNGILELTAAVIKRKVDAQERKCTEQNDRCSVFADNLRRANLLDMAIKLAPSPDDHLAKADPANVASQLKAIKVQARKITSKLALLHLVELATRCKPLGDAAIEIVLRCRLTWPLQLLEDSRFTFDTLRQILLKLDLISDDDSLSKESTRQVIRVIRIQNALFSGNAPIPTNPENDPGVRGQVDLGAMLEARLKYQLVIKVALKVAGERVGQVKILT